MPTRTVYGRIGEGQQHHHQQWLGQVVIEACGVQVGDKKMAHESKSPKEMEGEVLG